MKEFAVLQITASGVGGVLAYLFGEWEGLIIALTVAVCLDYITGVIAAGVSGKLSSKTGFRGLFKKIAIFAMIALCGLVDKAVPAASGAFRQAACAFYIANEALSIIENVGEIGVPVPKFLKNAVLTLKLKNDSLSSDADENTTQPPE